ncbi:hypothetical protein [Undibacterium sp. Ren11W]|uniref:hypothetical protein n=1 Tax=Undibacterium sp. Ren11W TaxID=3413045 RepID=UPI003BF1E9C8
MDRQTLMIVGGLAIFYVMSKEREWSAKIDQLNANTRPVGAVAGAVVPWLDSLGALIKGAAA